MQFPVDNIEFSFAEYYPGGGWIIEHRDPLNILRPQDLAVARYFLNWMRVSPLEPKMTTQVKHVQSSRTRRFILLRLKLFILSPLPGLSCDAPNVRELLAFLEAVPLCEGKECYDAHLFVAELEALPDKNHTRSRFHSAWGVDRGFECGGMMEPLAVASGQNGMASTEKPTFPERRCYSSISHLHWRLHHYAV